MMFLTCMLFTLAIGFGVGYWLLVTANTQNQKWMANLGSIFGWIIILLSITTLIDGIFIRPDFGRHMPPPQFGQGGQGGPGGLWGQMRESEPMQQMDEPPHFDEHGEHFLEHGQEGPDHHKPVNEQKGIPNKG